MKLETGFILFSLQEAKIMQRLKCILQSFRDAIINEFNAYNTDIIDSISLLLVSAKGFVISKKPVDFKRADVK